MLASPDEDDMFYPRRWQLTAQQDLQRMGLLVDILSRPGSDSIEP